MKLFALAAPLPAVAHKLHLQHLSWSDQAQCYITARQVSCLHACVPEKLSRTVLLSCLDHIYFGFGFFTCECSDNILQFNNTLLRWLKVGYSFSLWCFLKCNYLRLATFLPESGKIRQFSILQLSFNSVEGLRKILCD